MPKARLITAAFTMALVLGTFIVASASAAPAGWMVNGTMLTGSKALATTAKVDEVMRLESTGITVECNGETVNSVSPEIIAPERSKAASIAFTGCSASEPCSLARPEIKTVPVLLVGLTLDGILNVKGSVIPHTKTLFTTILFEGANCALAGIQPLTGKIDYLVHEGQDPRLVFLKLIFTLKGTGELKLSSSEATFKTAFLVRLATNEIFNFL